LILDEFRKTKCMEILFFCMDKIYHAILSIK